MYLAIDIGGTKTLLSVFDAEGTIVDSFKFPTPANYNEFKAELADNIKQHLANHGAFDYCCCAVPARLDRTAGVALGFGNLDWKNIPIRDDVQAIVGSTVIIENDANLAGLSEASYVADKYKKVLYITISTGIGDGIITDGIIDNSLADSEPGHMVFEIDGVAQTWEHLVSGKAIVRRFGKKAADITDPETWKLIVHDIAKGLVDTMATVQPDVIIIGGGVGAHFDKYGQLLNQEMKKYKDLVGPVIDVPPVIGARHPEEAVIYGCYELIRQTMAKTD